jgi:hypothetical protein
VGKAVKGLQGAGFPAPERGFSGVFSSWGLIKKRPRGKALRRIPKALSEKKRGRPRRGLPLFFSPFRNIRPGPKSGGRAPEGGSALSHLRKDPEFSDKMVIGLEAFSNIFVVFPKEICEPRNGFRDARLNAREGAFTETLFSARKTKGY